MLTSLLPLSLQWQHHYHYKLWTFTSGCFRFHVFGEKLLANYVVLVSRLSKLYFGHLLLWILVFKLNCQLKTSHTTYLSPILSEQFFDGAIFFPTVNRLEAAVGNVWEYGWGIMIAHKSNVQNFLAFKEKAIGKMRLFHAYAVRAFLMADAYG